MKQTRLLLGIAVMTCLAVGGCKKGSGTGVDDVDPEFVVNEFQEHDQMKPVVVSMPNGLFLLVWQSGCEDQCSGQDGSEYGIYARRFEPNGLPLGAEFRVNDTVDHKQQDPHAAMLPDGRFAIVWANESGNASDSYDVRLKLYGSEGVELGPEIEVNTEVANTQWMPKVGLSSDGVAHVFWEHEGGMGSGIMQRRFDAYGDPLGADELVPGADGGSEPAVASQADGRSVVVWAGWASIQAQRYADGQTVGSTVEVSETEGYVAQYPMPAVALGPTGEFVVAWAGGENWEDNHDIRARAFDADGSPLCDELAVNLGIEGIQTRPAVAVSVGGDQFLVTWESALEQGADKEIIAKTFQLDGTVSAEDFVVNSYQAQMQDRPSATPTYGGFLVAWQSSPEQGDGFNVYVKLYPEWP